MGHQPKFDLRIIGHHEGPPLGGDEASPNRLTSGRSHRDILEIRVRGREPSGCRTGLVEAGVDSPGSLIHSARKNIHVGRLQFLKFPVLEEEPGHDMAHLRQLLEYVRIGRRAGLGFLENRQLELFEEDHGQLFRAVEIDGPPGLLGDLGLEPDEVIGTAIV